MEESGGRRNILIIIIGGGLLILLFLFLLFWLVGKATGPSETATTSTSTTQTETAAPTSPDSENVLELISYTLPSGWTEENCDSTPGAVYPVAPDRELDCTNDPDNVISIFVDPEDNTDCNQLQDVQNVSKHICKSIFIDGNQTLEAQTIYTQDSAIYANRTIDAYYINTGNDVVVARYIHPGSGEMLSEFQAIVQSIKTK